MGFKLSPYILYQQLLLKIVITRKLEELYYQELEESEEYFAESISMQRKEASKKSELFLLLQVVLPLA
ncbi:hypothetical protein LKW28_12425 [Bacillus sp. REN16]|nr:hypothetical protein [Bacillus sp. REN16]